MKILLILFAVYSVVSSEKCDYSFGKQGVFSAENHFVHRFHIPRGDTTLVAKIPNDDGKMVSHVCVDVSGVDLDLDTIVVNFSTASQLLTVKLAYQASRKVWIDVSAEQHAYVNLRYAQNYNNEAYDVVNAD